VDKILIDRESLEHALEALVQSTEWAEFDPRCDSAINAIRAALVQPEQIIEPNELAAALGWPGGVSDQVLDKVELLRMVARLPR
jgi:hypothetical protein